MSHFSKTLPVIPDMLQRSLLSSAFCIALFLGLVTGCRKDQVQTVTKTDSSRTSTVVTAPAPTVATDTAAIAGKTARPPESHSAPSAGSLDTSAFPQGSARILDDNDPIAKQLVESMKHPEQPKLRVNPNPGSEIKLIEPARLSDLQPKIPGYQLVGEPVGFRSQSFSRSSAVLRSQFDTSHIIRVLIVDENEHEAGPFQQQIQMLQQKGSITSYPNGEASTAYYVQVNGAPAAKSFLPAKKVATVSVLVSGHRMMQLRESHATSADHLMEIAKYLEVKKFEALQ